MQKFFDYGSHTLDISVEKIYKAEKKEWNTFSVMPMLSEDDEEDICYIEESAIKEKQSKRRVVP